MSGNNERISYEGLFDIESLDNIDLSPLEEEYLYKSSRSSCADLRTLNEELRQVNASLEGKAELLLDFDDVFEGSNNLESGLDTTGQRLLRSDNEPQAYFSNEDPLFSSLSYFFKAQEAYKSIQSIDKQRASNTFMSAWQS
ncbi:MAG: hypothetical protein V4496_06200 [Pseudomonadota bacterium]